MKKIAWVLTALLLAACGNHDQTVAGAANPAPDAGLQLKLVNPGFESPMQNGEIPGWTLQQHAGANAYEFALDSDHAFAGRQSARITRTQVQVYGSLEQRVDARQLVGKTVELSAMMRCKDVGPKGLKLMLNGGRSNAVVYSPALSGTTDWQRETIRLKVPKTVATLNIGVTLLDAGSGWLDDVRLSIVGR